MTKALEVDAIISIELGKIKNREEYIKAKREETIDNITHWISYLVVGIFGIIYLISLYGRI